MSSWPQQYSARNRLMLASGVYDSSFLKEQELGESNIIVAVELSFKHTPGCRDMVRSPRHVPAGRIQHSPQHSLHDDCTSRFAPRQLAPPLVIAARRASPPQPKEPTMGPEQAVMAEPHSTSCHRPRHKSTAAQSRDPGGIPSHVQTIRRSRHVIRYLSWAST